MPRATAAILLVCAVLQTRADMSGEVQPAHLAVTSVNPEAQSVPALSLRLDQWLGAVLGHTPGELDAAAKTVAPWSESELDSILGGLQQQFRLFLTRRSLPAFSAIFERHGLVDPAAMNRALGLAAFLHADVAMLHRTREGYALPSDNNSIRVFSDGRQIGAVGGTVHWPFARALLAAREPRPFTDEYTRLWYRATSAFFHHWNDYSQESRHLAQARTLLPGDEVLMMYDGALHEAYAGPRVQQAIVPSRLPVMMGPILAAADEWQNAENQFRAALRADPGLTEARIRLGHVLERRGSDIDAISELERALADDPPRIMKYYGLLFLGRARHAVGRSDAARTAFDEAQSLYPGAQSPRLGLSALARAAGDRTDAIGTLAPFFTATETLDRSDPYWVYHLTHSPDLGTLVADLRRASVALRSAHAPGPVAGGPRPVAALSRPE